MDDQQPSVLFTSDAGRSYDITSDQQADTMIQNYDNAATQDQAQINQDEADIKAGGSSSYIAGVQKDMRGAQAGYNAATDDASGVQAKESQLNSELATYQAATQAASNNVSTEESYGTPASVATAPTTTASTASATQTQTNQNPNAPGGGTTSNGATGILGTSHSIAGAAAAAQVGVTSSNPNSPTSGTSTTGATSILGNTQSTASTASAAQASTENPNSPTSGTSSAGQTGILGGSSSGSSGSAANPASGYHSPEVGHQNLAGEPEGGVGHQNLGDNPISPYTVQSNDSMSAIAEKYGVSLQDLENSNKNITNPNVIFPGNSINIPSDAKYPAGNGTVDLGGTGSGDASGHVSPTVVAPTPQNPNSPEGGTSSNGQTGSLKGGGSTSGSESKPPEDLAGLDLSNMSGFSMSPPKGSHLTGGNKEIGIAA